MGVVWRERFYFSKRGKEGSEAVERGGTRLDEKGIAWGHSYGQKRQARKKTWGKKKCSNHVTKNTRLVSRGSERGQSQKKERPRKLYETGKKQNGHIGGNPTAGRAG